MILVAVSLDPHNVQEADFELPLWEWKLPDHGSLDVEDLMRGGGFDLDRQAAARAARSRRPAVRDLAHRAAGGAAMNAPQKNIVAADRRTIRSGTRTRSSISCTSSRSSTPTMTASAISPA